MSQFATIAVLRAIFGNLKSALLKELGADIQFYDWISERFETATRTQVHCGPHLFDYELVSEFRLLEELTVGFSLGMGQIGLDDLCEGALMPRLP